MREASEKGEWCLSSVSGVCLWYCGGLLGGYNVRHWRTGQASVFASRAPGLFETREGKARYSEDISQDMSSRKWQYQGALRHGC